MLKKLALLSIVIGMGVVLAGKVCAEPLTAAMCKAKAIEAAKMIEAEGAAGFAKLKDPAAGFRFGDNNAGHIWVHDSKNVMRAHPVKPEMEGTSCAEMKDVKGSYFIVNMTDLVMEKNAGWVTYSWPKPGKQDVSPKASYVVKAVNGGETFVVGSGLYDVTAADIKKEFPSDPIVDGTE